MSSNIQKEPLKCPKCKKDLNSQNHALLNKVGIYNGSGSDLGWNIIKKVYKKDHFYEHPFFYLSDLESKDKNIVSKTMLDVKLNNITNRYGIEAHHLICSANFKDRRIQKYVYLLGYNINHFKNGVLLPKIMKVACSFNVPLHKGSHNATFVLNNDDKNELIVSVTDKEQELTDVNYVNSTRKMLVNVIRRVKFENLCNINKLREEAKKFINNMDQASQKIFKLLRSFQWTLTSDGFDYQKGRCGCLDSNSLPKKRYKRNYLFKINPELNMTIRENETKLYNNNNKLKEIYKYDCKHKKYKNPLSVNTKFFKERDEKYIMPLKEIE